MSKYINTENLLAEIEKRRKQRVEVNEKINKGEIYTETEDDFNRALARYGNRLVYQELFEIICFIEFLQQEQPEVDLEKFTEKIKTFQARYKHPESISVKGAMAFMARMFYQYPNVARQWYDGLPKATMDDARKEE